MKAIRHIFVQGKKIGEERGKYKEVKEKQLFTALLSIASFALVAEFSSHSVPYTVYILRK